MKNAQKTTLLALFAFLAADAFAYELDSVVTTGTRTPMLLKDSPVPIDVVTAEQLSVVSSGTLSEALNFIPGVSVNRSTKDGYNVQMQGFDGDHVLVLLNGQRLVSPTGSSVDLDQINAQDVERIEILKGAASVMYGSSAMGGVMNIITKPIETNTNRISYEVGSFTNNAISEDPLEHRVALTSAMTNSQYSGRINYQFIDRPGFKYDDSQKVENGTANEKHFLDGQFTFHSPLGKILYQPQYFKEQRYRKENDTNVPGQGFFEDAYESEVERITQSLEIRSQHNLTTRLRLSNHEEFSGHLTKATRNADITQGSAEVQKVWMFNSAEWVMGAEYNNEQLDLPADGIVGKTRDSYQAFSQVDVYVTDDLELLAGIRVQDNQGFGSHHASRVSGMYRYNLNQGDQLRIRFGAGQSYKVPSLKELHYILDHSNVGSGYVVIGNEDLQPEETLSYNLGGVLDFASGTQLEANLFYSDSKNFIENEFSQDFTNEWGVDAYVYQNINTLTTKGGDFNIKHALNHYQSVNLSYHYLEARNEQNERLENRPRNQIKLNFISSHYWLNTKIITYAVYQSDEAFTLDDPATTEDEGYLAQHNNDWVSLNVSVTQQPTKSLTLRYGIQNILDEHKNTSVADDYFDAREEDSRRIYLGMSYDF
ncbi:MAG: TonB-dependent receptor [Bermanella sp.]